MKSVEVQFKNVHKKEPHVRIYLYLQLQQVSYNDLKNNTLKELEIYHPKDTITRLNEQYPRGKNVINLNRWEREERPTFSITVDQDSTDDIAIFGNVPLTLILYEQKLGTKSRTSITSGKTRSDSRTTVATQSTIQSTKGSTVQSTKGSTVPSTKASTILSTKESTIPSTKPSTIVSTKASTINQSTNPSTIQSDTSIESNESDGPRQAIAEGYIDLFNFFQKKRIQNTLRVFLYPLKSSQNIKSFYTVWDVYSIMPLVRNVTFSNAIYLSFTSIYNASDDIMNNCDDLVATISIQKPVKVEPNSKNKKDDNKVFICEYTGFWKQKIGTQSLNLKWESLKDAKLNNYQCMGINSDMKFTIHKTFTQLMRPENTTIDITQIDFKNDYAIVCNGLQRFILTDTMHNDLQQYVTCSPQNLIIEIFQASDPKNILWIGQLDFSIFLYPKVNACSFAVELKQPNTESGRQARNDDNATTTFAVIKICVKQPITEPALDLNQIFNVSTTKRDIYRTCIAYETTATQQQSFSAKHLADTYSTFDDYIFQLTLNLTKHPPPLHGEAYHNFLCSQKLNMMNNILPLITHDFNVRYPTKTNREFHNLMSHVFQELADRVYQMVDKEPNKTPTRIMYTAQQAFIIERMTIAKYMHEIGNLQLSCYLMNQLQEEYKFVAMLKFFIFLSDIEKGDYETAKMYLQLPLRERDVEGELFTDIIRIYINYMQDLKNANYSDDYAVNDVNTVREKLLMALVQFCEVIKPKCQMGWMILYCVYKKCNYGAGMNYARWQFENLQATTFYKIKYIPFSLWEIYNSYVPQFATNKGKYLWDGVYNLLRLGLYKFAEWLFQEIADECLEAEKYVLETTFKIVTNTLDIYFTPITKFSIPADFPQATHLQASICVVNGHAAFYLASSLDNYKFLLEQTDITDTSLYQLGILRYAYGMISQHYYKEALHAFDFASSNYGHQLIKSIGKAKALYYLNRLEEAKNHFAKTTHLSLYNPNTWAYLAVINLRLGDNYKALECWKYAKLDANNIIHSDIIAELEKIDYDNVDLFVDDEP